MFTYDLILEVMKAGLVSSFTFIPMLTGPDGTGHGDRADRSRAKAGTRNMELMDFLDNCIEKNTRDIRRLADFFEDRGINISIYEREFSHRHRHEYFAQVADESLVNSLVFIDPDIGLEVQRPTEKHLLYAEVQELYQRMGGDSILMLYQYFPRLPHQEYLNQRCTEIKEMVMGDWPVCIDDNEVVFFFLTKDEALEHRLTHVISDYAELYSR